MSVSLKSTILNSLVWKFTEQLSVGIVQLVIGIILARLLLPEDYAIVIIATVFITLSKIFIDSGLSSALIQKKKIDDADTSSVFYISLSIALALYCLIFFGAPVIASIYNSPELVSVLRVMGLMLFIGVFTSMQQVFVSRQFLFKKQFLVSLISGLISGVVGVVCAVYGFGVWALVIQQLISAILIALLLQTLVKWKPKLLFSIKKSKALFSFGWKILVASLIGQAYESIRDLSIGAFYSKNDLAYYNKGYEYPTFLCTALDGSIAAVLFPAFTKCQDDRETLKLMLRRSIMVSSFVVFPAMFGLVAVAEPFVRLLLTDKWLLCVPFLQIFCIYQSIQPISSANLAAIKAVGRTDILLRLEIIKRCFGFICLFISLPFGVMAVAYGALIFKIFSVAINVFPNKSIFGYKYGEMLRDILPSVMLSMMMALFVYCVSFFGLPLIITLCIQIILGIVIYLCGAKILHMYAMDFVISSLKDYLRK